MWHYLKHFTCTNSFKTSQQPCDIGTHIILICGKTDSQFNLFKIHNCLNGLAQNSWQTENFLKQALKRELKTGGKRGFWDSTSE